MVGPGGLQQLPSLGCLWLIEPPTAPRPALAPSSPLGPGRPAPCWEMAIVVMARQLDLPASKRAAWGCIAYLSTPGSALKQALMQVPSPETAC
jgi:hypothetical protein